MVELTIQSDDPILSCGIYDRREIRQMKRIPLGLLSVLCLVLFGCATTPAPDPDAAKAELSYATLAMRENKPEQAKAHYDRVLQFDPRLAEAYLGRGICHGATGNKSAAIADFTRALKLSPNLAIAYHYRALALEETGKVRQAISNLDTAIAIEPQSGDYLNHRGYLHGRLGEYDRSISDLDLAVKYKPRSATSRCNRAFARFCIGDLAGCLADFGQALVLRPSMPRVHFLRALARELTGDFSSAEQDFEKALENEADSTGARLHRAMLLRQMRPEAHDEYRSLLSVGWTDKWPDVAAGYLAGRLTDRDFLAVARAAPGDRAVNLCQAYYLMGRQYELSHNVSSAISAYRKCLDTHRYDESESAAARIRLKRLTQP